MLTILINAYACAPNMGSEPGMGWNWCINLAQYCNLHIITEGEFKEQIEQALLHLPQSKNLHFYYNPVSEETRRMCWNQGDWRFYKYYKEWQYKTFLIALEIIKNNKIDIIHQLNMIGFREPGYMWKIDKIPFVWGPIGGLKQFPTPYLKGSSLKIKLFNLLKNYINVLQLKHDNRVNKAFKRANLLISSIPDSYDAILKHKHLKSIVIPETGCFITNNIKTDKFDDTKLHLIWVGKFDFRKQLPLAIKAMKQANNPNIHLDIYGTGNKEQIKEAKNIVSLLNIEHQITWYGNQPNSKVIKAMQMSHIFLFTSVSEDTSTVVLEAISNGLPVLCFKTCGMEYVINDKVGIKIPLSNPSQSIIDFANNINKLEQNRTLLKTMSENCKQRRQELSWDNKARQMVDYYKRIITDKNNQK